MRRSRCSSPITTRRIFISSAAKALRKWPIETLEVIATSGRVDLREALEWAAANKDALRAKWNELSGS